jgi:hypothetical protein
MTYRSAQTSRHFARMVPYPKNKNAGCHLELCAVCDAVVAGWAAGNTACATCGMTVVEPPFEGSDYFDIIMRQGTRRAARRRRPS